MQLLVPLVYCKHFAPAEEQEIRRKITDHAGRGLKFLEQCSESYSSRYNMPLAAFCILHLSDALIRFASPDEVDLSGVASICLKVLKDNRPGFPICGPLQQMFREMLAENSIDVPFNADDEMGSASRYGIDELLDATTRLTYKQPTDQIARFIDHAIGGQWAEEWEKQIVRTRWSRQSINEKTMQIDRLLNT